MKHPERYGPNLSMDRDPLMAVHQVHSGAFNLLVLSLYIYASLKPQNGP